MKTVDLGAAFVSHFPVFAADGVTKVSGETVFQATVWHNGAAAFVPVNITEIGVSGEYRVTCAPTAEGEWGVEVYTPNNGDLWGEDFTVRTPPMAWGLAAVDDNTTATFSLWLERDGQRQTDVEVMFAVVRDADGALVIDLGTDNAPTAEGVFTFSCPSAALPVAAEYHVDALATRGPASWYANLGFAKL